MQHSTLEDMALHRKQVARLIADPLLSLWVDAEVIERFAHEEMDELGPYAARVVEQEARWLTLVHGVGMGGL